MSYPILVIRLENIMITYLFTVTINKFAFQNYCFMMLFVDQTNLLFTLRYIITNVGTHL